MKENIWNCPSCGADLPDGIKDIVCPYCGSTIFSDYYDWQLESLEIEPEHLKLSGFIGWMIIVLASGGNGSRVKKRTGERCCPACGAAFTPDEDGNCIHCGSFLFKENYKWRVVQ